MKADEDSILTDIIGTREYDLIPGDQFQSIDKAERPGIPIEKDLIISHIEGTVLLGMFLGNRKRSIYQMMMIWNFERK